MSRRDTPRSGDSIGLRDAMAWSVPRAGFWSVGVAARQRQRPLRIRADRGGAR